MKKGTLDLAAWHASGNKFIAGFKNGELYVWKRNREKPVKVYRMTNYPNLPKRPIKRIFWSTLQGKSFLAVLGGTSVSNEHATYSFFSFLYSSSFLLPSPLLSSLPSFHFSLLFLSFLVSFPLVYFYTSIPPSFLLFPFPPSHPSSFLLLPSSFSLSLSFLARISQPCFAFFATPQDLRMNSGCIFPLLPSSLSLSHPFPLSPFPTPFLPFLLPPLPFPSLPPQATFHYNILEHSKKREWN